MNEVQDQSFEDAIAHACARLVSVRHEAEGSFLTTPLMYPSGGSVVVWVDRAPPHFYVTDYGFGARECEIMGADRRQFTRHAAPIAEASGIDLALDGSFEVMVSESQLEGAIKAVAACSNEVAISFAHRRQQRERADVRTILVAKLQRVFGEKAVARELEFQGESETAWQIDAAVTRGSEVALFETVTPWFPSVASTLAKFGDIKLLAQPPIRTAVLSSREGFGSWITALAQNAHVVQARADDDVYSRLVGVQ